MNEAIDIEALIPHRRPMRLVEEVITVEAEAIVTGAVVRETWPTAERGCARTLVLVELVAQSAAVLQGWRERRDGKTASGGLLVGIPQATPSEPALPLGTRLLCSVRITHGAPNYLAFEGEVKDTRGVLWLTAAIQAFRPDEHPPSGESP
jgi:predicted hotdog family 3-hydroxylacyl-ACP dehydratase